jgi:hypothetical protein
MSPDRTPSSANPPLERTVAKAGSNDRCRRLAPAAQRPSRKADRGQNKMWRPRKLGTVIAERRLTFARRRKPARTVSVRFGRPVRSPQPRRGDPWWCPVEITGLGKSDLRSIAGEDSLQSLVLALEFATRVVPFEAERAGGHLEWLGERERLVFAGTLLAGMTNVALQNLVDGLGKAVDVFENGDGRRPAVARDLLRDLKALIVSGGYTADPARIPRPPIPALERSGSAGRSAP